jgi:ribosomal protein S27E
MSAVSVRCPGCQERLAVPTPAPAAIVCPKCRRSVPVGDDGNTLIDGRVPDFSYLRQQAEADDDVLRSEEPDEAESALGENSARRPAAKPAAKLAPATPQPVVYTPPPVEAANPFAAISNRSPKSLPRATAKPVQAPPQGHDQHAPPPLARRPAWVWPALIGLVLYGVAATGVAAWGWLRPTAAAPVSTKAAR